MNKHPLGTYFLNPRPAPLDFRPPTGGGGGRELVYLFIALTSDGDFDLKIFDNDKDGRPDQNFNV